jgi:hypothetical protein
MKAYKKLNESLNNFRIKEEKLTKNQLYIFTAVLILTLILKFLLIPYNMFDHGEAATRTWNALWWAESPFFIEPVSGNPGWFYFMGPLIMITREIFYTPIIVMTLSVTLAGFYIFKLAMALTEFKIALIAYLLFTFSPAIFRLNYSPVPQQLYLAALCIMIYYYVKAMLDSDGKNSRKNFTIAGIFSFIGLTFRPEALFVLLPFCLLALLIQKKGKYEYIVLALLFQFIWILVSYWIYGNPFKTFQEVRQYDYLVGSQLEDKSTLLKFKGFFLPYYFMLTGLTVIIFYFFLRGIIISYKNYPLLITAAILIPVLVPAFVNGLSGTMSTQYHTTRYFYSTFYYSSFIAAIGAGAFINRYKNNYLQWTIVLLIILTSIPLSYIKEFVPGRLKKVFPKVIQFIVTSEDPEDAKMLIRFIDEYIKSFPSLIFDSDGSDSSILYVPFRTKLPPPDKVLISGYNIPVEKIPLQSELIDFIRSNQKGIVMIKKDKTLMNEIFSDTSWIEQAGLKLKHEMDTEKWSVYTFSN